MNPALDSWLNLWVFCYKKKTIMKYTTITSRNIHFVRTTTDWPWIFSPGPGHDHFPISQGYPVLFLPAIYPFLSSVGPSSPEDIHLFFKYQISATICDTLIFIYCPFLIVLFGFKDFWYRETKLVGGFKHFLFSTIYGIILPIDFHIFQDD